MQACRCCGPAESVAADAGQLIFLPNDAGAHESRSARQVLPHDAHARPDISDVLAIRGHGRANALVAVSPLVGNESDSQAEVTPSLYNEGGACSVEAVRAHRQQYRQMNNSIKRSRGSLRC